jgi:glycosyltransferase involved in cell wall biosynthesis
VKVLFINHTNTISGAGISLSTLLSYLPHDVKKFFLLHRKSQLAERFGTVPEFTHREPLFSQMHTTLYGEGMGIGLTAFHYLKASFTLLTLAYLNRKWRPDVIHLNETVLAPYAVSASLLGIPLVVHARTLVQAQSLGMRLLSWVAGRGHCAFISIDHETHASLPPTCQQVGVVIHNPVEMRLASDTEIQAKRKSWGVPEDAILVGQLASLHKEKGIWQILEMAKGICARNPKIHFILAGDTNPAVSEGPLLAKAIQEAGLQNCIHLVGYERDLPAAYGALDIVLCMFGEYLRGVGRTAYEAPLAAKPLIATLPNPECSQTLIHRKTGLGFECTDYAGVANAILDFADHPDKRLALGKTAFESIKDRHDPKAVASRVIEVYREVIHQQPGNL